MHALSVDSLQKIQKSLKRVIIGREQKGRHPEKDASFDILSLADQLHRSKSTNLDGPDKGKIYFSENEVPDLVKEGSEAMWKAVEAYNKSIEENKIMSKINNKAVLETLEAAGETSELFELDGADHLINEMFNSAREGADLTSDLSELFL